jgi:acyl-CoA thioesterase
LNDSNASRSEPANPNYPEARGVAGKHVPYLDLLDMKPIRTEDGKVEFELEVKEKHLRTLGIAHGGVVASLMDSAVGFAAGTTAPPGYHVVTVQLNVNFIRPSWEGEKLIAKGTVLHAGKQTAVARGEIRTAENYLVASGMGTFMYIMKPVGTTNMPKGDETERAK